MNTETKELLAKDKPFVINQGRAGTRIIWPSHEGWVSSMPSLEIAEMVIRAVNEYEALCEVADAAKDLCQNLHNAQTPDYMRKVYSLLAKLKSIRN